MLRIRRIATCWALLMALSLACLNQPSEMRTYEGEKFSFTIPVDWQTNQEIWGESAASGQEFKGLGVQELVLIQYPQQQGKGKAFFVVSSATLAEGQDLESRFNQVYQDAVPEIEEASEQSFALGERAGFEITYKRPWGEPWWKFRDIWLEKDGMVYVLSFYASPNSFDTYAETFKQILESFRFKE